MGEDSRDPALCMAFVEEVTAMLTWASHVKHELSVDDDQDHCVLSIPKADKDGFDITIEVYPDDIEVRTEGGHFHLDPEPQPSETAQSVVGLLRDLLSPHMRIREELSWGKPHKWHLESIHDGRWTVEQTTGLLFGIRLGRRSECIYQNRVLEGRMDGSPRSFLE